jgi:hypothetical protein
MNRLSVDGMGSEDRWNDSRWGSVYSVIKVNAPAEQNKLLAMTDKDYNM